MLTPPTFQHRTAGEVRTAELLPFKLKHPKTRMSPAQRLGVAYENRAYVHLMTELKGEILRHPAFRFNAGNRFDEHAIPDAIYLKGSTLTIFEIKLRHTADAWYQLRKLYLPIVSKAYPGADINLCEICKSYDPSIRLAGETEIVDKLSAFVATPNSSYGIYIWSGR